MQSFLQLLGQAPVAFTTTVPVTRSRRAPQLPAGAAAPPGVGRVPGGEFTTRTDPDLGVAAATPAHRVRVHCGMSHRGYGCVLTPESYKKTSGAQHSRFSGPPLPFLVLDFIRRAKSAFRGLIPGGTIPLVAFGS
jgi:hypothetical protein